MSRPVDVLAVLDAAIENIGGPTDLGLTEARAAVAELVAAASAGHRMATYANVDTLYFSPTRTARLRAALAKFGGAA